VNIQDEIASFLVNTLKVAADVSDVRTDASLVDDLGVDSAGVFEMILWLEDRFGVHFRPEDIELKNFATVETAASYIERCRAESAQAE
jgi:acyl carrier protein